MSYSLFALALLVIPMAFCIGYLYCNSLSRIGEQMRGNHRPSPLIPKRPSEGYGEQRNGTDR